MAKKFATMATDESRGDSNDESQEWLARIKEQVKQKMAERWRDGKWTDFLEEVARLLRRSEDFDEDIVVTAVGLITYGIRNKEDLQRIAKSQKEFGDRLKESVLLAFCDELYETYVAPQQQRGLPPSPSPSKQERPLYPPPSTGKEPSRQPEFDALKSPSSQEGQKNGLEYGPEMGPPLYCSSNSIAIHVVSLLLEIVANKMKIADIYRQAAEHILHARRLLENPETPDVLTNERFYTGAFSDGLNAVMKQGFSVLHQSCVGVGATHSDLSGRFCLDRWKCPTLLVGEGKVGSSKFIRRETRGQLFNELIRHRKIDRIFHPDGDYRPILLLAFNYRFVSLELAFPSTKGGHMEKSGWVAFNKYRKEEEETFWTIPVAFVEIDGLEGTENLAILLRFISDTMDYLYSLDGTPRVQFKTPWVIEPSGGAKDGQKRGDNVTIIITESEDQKVYKEFCYYLRERDGFNYLMDQTEEVDAADQRQPPPRELLNRLGSPYSSWSLNTYANGRIKILVYDYIKGTHRPTSKDCWIEVMKQVQTMHSLNFIHGDLLPRNLIFSGNEGYVIDFDLMREENRPYVSGYNSDFRPYRHKDANASAEMKKEHDVWALAQMSKEYFDIPEKAIDVDEIKEVSMLLEYFEKNDVVLKNLPPDIHFSEDATGSPVRDAVGSLTDRLGGMGVH